MRSSPGQTGAPISILGRYAPLLALTPARRPALYIESIRWWASIQTLIEADVGGLTAVRRDARSDLSTHRLVHTLTQARLASIGMCTGAEVVLEPGKSGGPGDLLLRWAGQEVFLEVVTFGPDENNETRRKASRPAFSSPAQPEAGCAHLLGGRHSRPP